jgi:signal transduction histidine kinase
MFDEWLGVVVSIFIVSGVILIRELFMSLKKAEIERKRSENNVIIAIINTEEEERKRFAKDLHDGLAPILSTVKMSLSALTGKVDDKTGVEVLSNSNHLINEAINAIKEISNNLSPHVLSNFGLASAINAFATKINETKSIKIEFKSNMENQRLNNDKEVVLYRAVCELINNSICHSGASQIDIELNKHEKFVTLQFNDNGRGFNTAILYNKDNKGMGLSNIKARVRSGEGVFILESVHGKGTNALIKINE